MAKRSKEDLEQNVVEEEGAEDAAQLLALLDVPQGESLAEVVPARLLQPSQVQTTFQLAPDNTMSPTWTSKPHNACWCPSPTNCQSDFFVFLPVDVVLHPAGHHVACPLVHRLDGFDDLQRDFITLEGNCNDHPEQLGGGALLAVQVVAHQVHILLGQQQGHLPIKGEIEKGLIKATLVLTATRSSAKCCSS